MAEASAPESFKAARGRKVISRATAEPLGEIAHLVVDAGSRSVTHLAVGRRRSARLIDWAQVTGFGSDAVLVAADESAREPLDDRELAAARGELELLGRRVLSDRGDELGRVEDVSFDPDTGLLGEITVNGSARDPSDLLGAGSYAVVLRSLPAD